MSDLLRLLSLGSNAISASNAGVAVATNNVANANTEGYSRERVELSSLIGPPTLGGVKVGALSRSADDLLSARIRAAAGNLAGSTTRRDGLSDLEVNLSANPTSDKLAALFASLDKLAASPADPTARTVTVAAFKDVAGSLHDAASQIATARSQADAAVGGPATQATALAAQLARANKAVRSGDPTAADHRDLLATQLSKLVGGQARIDPDGNMRFVLDGGAVLVDGDHAATLSTQVDPATGLSKVIATDGNATRDVTAQLTGGQIGGALALRDQISAVGDKYDKLAADLVASVNSVSTGNAALDGTTGHAVFATLSGTKGAAAAISLDPALEADPANLATGAVGSGPGDNTGALALFDLANTRAASGGTRTLSDASLDILSDLGSATATAKADAAGDQVLDQHLGDLRDSLAGVDITEEQANLTRYESSVSALTKFVSTIDNLMTNLIQNL